MATWRIRWHDPHQIFKSQDTPPMIFCLWHNRLALSMKIYRGFVRDRSQARGLAAMISASKDGGLLAETLSYFGVTAVRGSTSRRGRQALLELTRMARDGYGIAITPDGPRGPKYVVQDGILALSQLTGLAIVPTRVEICSKFSLRSWDNFQIPWPFSIIHVHFGSLLNLPRNADQLEREQIRAQLQKLMEDIPESNKEAAAMNRLS